MSFQLASHKTEMYASKKRSPPSSLSGLSRAGAQIRTHGAVLRCDIRSIFCFFSADGVRPPLCGVWYSVCFFEANEDLSKERHMNAIEREHPTWTHAFNEEARSQQLHDDSTAWRAVTGILITIVSVGACLAIISVWICA